MKVQDVTPEYIKALQAAGFKPSIDDIVERQGARTLLPNSSRKPANTASKDLTIEKLIQLKHLGILDSKADL